MITPWRFRFKAIITIYFLVNAVTFKSLNLLPNNEGILVEIDLSESPPVNLNTDIIRVLLCKLYGNQECKERRFPISSRIKQLELREDFLVGDWKFTLRFIKSPSDMSKDSVTKHIKRCK